MCKECAEALPKPENKGKRRHGFKMSKEERAKLPGKESHKRAADRTPEEDEAHKVYKRAYEKIYRDFRRSQEDDTYTEYQREYHKLYNKNHIEQLRDYVRGYVKENPEHWVRAYNRREVRKSLVASEKYTEQDILDRWGTDCYICSFPIDLEAPRGTGVPGWEMGLQLDHVIPLVDLGPDTIENVKPTHGICNIGKGSNKSPADYRKRTSKEELAVLDELAKERKKNKRKK